MPRHYADPPLLVHPHVFATWAKNDELRVVAVGGELIPVESVQVIQTTKSRKMFISYLAIDGTVQTMRFENPVVEDLDDGSFKVSTEDNSAFRGAGGFVTGQARVVRFRMPPAFLCPGCEVCRP